MILRFLAMVFYIMQVGGTLMYLFRGMSLHDGSEWFLFAGKIIMILEGSGKVDGKPFRKGDTILLPAAGETIGLEGRAIYLQIL